MAYANYAFAILQNREHFNLYTLVLRVLTTLIYPLRGPSDTVRIFQAHRLAARPFAVPTPSTCHATPAQKNSLRRQIRV
jgi:hypothetical protein